MAGLDATLSGNAYYKEIDASNLSFGGKRSTISYEGKAALDWRVSTRNRAQVNVEANGKELTPQGYKRGSVAVDVGYRFQVRPNFAVLVTASDVFASRRDEVVLDTAAITSSDTVRPPGRIVWVGVSWTLAASKDGRVLSMRSREGRSGASRTPLHRCMTRLSRCDREVTPA